MKQLPSKQEGAKQIESPKAQISQCPICHAVTTYMYYMQNGDNKDDKSVWYRCKCGVVWQQTIPEAVKNPEKAGEVYNEEYVDQFIQNGDKYIEVCKYPVRVFAPLIEELMFGRKVLEVGFNATFTMQEFADRGWIPFGIDINTSNKNSDRIAVGNFETHQFPEDMKFDLIWMSHVLEHFLDPVKALEKAKSLLSEDGCLYIATPDTDFIITRSSAGFPHWKSKEHYLMWNRESLCNKLEELGFDVIMSRRNYSERFQAWDDVQIIAQKKFF